MFVITEDKTICLTRGDIANIVVSANLQDGSTYIFKAGDVVRFQVFNKKKYENVVLRKEIEVEMESESVTISLTGKDTTIGSYISKPVEYCYEIEVNPDTAPQTIVGYDTDGEKIFRLYPEGGEEDE